MVGDVDRRARLGQTLPVLHARPDPQDPDDRGPECLSIDVADSDSQGPPRQQQQREQQIDDRPGRDQDEAGYDAHPGTAESQRPGLLEAARGRLSCQRRLLRFATGRSLGFSVRTGSKIGVLASLAN